MELVENYGADIFQGRIVSESPQKNALGGDDQGSRTGNPFLKANLLANFFSEPPVSLRGNPLRRGFCCDASWLQKKRAAIVIAKAGIDQAGRYSRSFSRPRWCLDDDGSRRF